MIINLPGPLPENCSRCGALIQRGQKCHILLEMTVKIDETTIKTEELKVECPICSLQRDGEERKNRTG